jgi:soluble lytic murein transglycosylase
MKARYKIPIIYVVLASSILFVMILIYLNSAFIGRIVYPIYYEQEIWESAANNEIDPYLVAAVIRVESNYNHTSVSNKGAIGIMQLMPDTASWIAKQGFQNDISKEEMETVKFNILLGTWYLHWLQNYYHGNMVSSIAAYNAGQGNVDEWIESGRWSGNEDDIELIPYGETRYFVKQVLHYYHKYVQFYEDT